MNRVEEKIYACFNPNVFFFQETKSKALLVHPMPINYVRGVGEECYEEIEGLIEEDIERLIG